MSWKKQSEILSVSVLQGKENKTIENHTSG